MNLYGGKVQGIRHGQYHALIFPIHTYRKNFKTSGNIAERADNAVGAMGIVERSI